MCALTQRTKARTCDLSTTMEERKKDALTILRIFETGLQSSPKISCCDILCKFFQIALISSANQYMLYFSFLKMGGLMIAQASLQLTL